MEGIREKTTVQIVVQRILEIDGTDSMNKILVEEVVEIGTVEEIMEKVRSILEAAKSHDFKFL